jgi:hypothetical protein
VKFNEVILIKACYSLGYLTLKIHHVTASFPFENQSNNYYAYLQTPVTFLWIKCFFYFDFSNLISKQQNGLCIELHFVLNQVTFNLPQGTRGMMDQNYGV